MGKIKKEEASRTTSLIIIDFLYFLQNIIVTFT